MSRLRDISKTKARAILKTLAKSEFNYEWTCEYYRLSKLMLNKIINKYGNYHDKSRNNNGNNVVVKIDSTDVTLGKAKDVILSKKIIDGNCKDLVLEKVEEVKLYALDIIKKLLTKETDLRAVNETVKILHEITSEMYTNENNGNNGSMAKSNFIQIIENQLISNQNGVAKQ